MQPLAESNQDDDREFTEEQLRVALKDVGKKAQEDAFRAGKPVHFIRGEAIIALYPDGREEIVKILRQRNGARNGNGSA